MARSTSNTAAACGGTSEKSGHRTLTWLKFVLQVVQVSAHVRRSTSDQPPGSAERVCVGDAH
jgi:hypothetical protein